MQTICSDAVGVIISLVDRNYWNALSQTCKSFLSVVSELSREQTRHKVDLDSILSGGYLSSYIWNVESRQARAKYEHFQSILNTADDGELCLRALGTVYSHLPWQYRRDISANINLHRIVRLKRFKILDAILVFMPSLPYILSYRCPKIVALAVSRMEERGESTNKYTLAIAKQLTGTDTYNRLLRLTEGTVGGEVPSMKEWNEEEETLKLANKTPDAKTVLRGTSACKTGRSIEAWGTYKSPESVRRLSYSSSDDE